jgi:hypothetical protein
VFPVLDASSDEDDGESGEAPTGSEAEPGDDA